MPVFRPVDNESFVRRAWEWWVGLMVGKVYVHEKRLFLIPVTMNMAFFSNISVLPPFSARLETFALVQHRRLCVGNLVDHTPDLGPFLVDRVRHTTVAFWRKACECQPMVPQQGGHVR